MRQSFITNHSKHWWLIRAGMILMVLVFVLLATTAAAHADQPTPSPKPSPSVPNENQFAGIKDSHGVPAEKYTVPPFDRGGLDNWSKAVTAFYIDNVWSFGVAALNGAMWFFQWLLSWEWVTFVTSPLQVFSLTVQQLFGGLKFIPFALAISGFVYGIHILRGKYGHGAINLVVTAIVAALMTGVLANPSTFVFGSDGVLTKSVNMGGQAAVAMITDGKNVNATSLKPSDVVNSTLNQQLTDIFLRDPAMYVSFGKKLSGDCEKVFDEKMKAVKVGDSGDNSVRDAVAKCDPQAKAFMEHPHGQLVLLASVSIGIGAFLLMAAALALILIGAVIVLAWKTLHLLVSGYLALLPGDERAGFWHVGFQVLAGIAATALSLLAVVLYLRYVIEVLTFMDVMGSYKYILLAALFLGGIVFVWVFRRKIHKAAEKAAAKMSGLMGAGKSAGASTPVSGAEALHRVANTARRTANTINRFRGQGGSVTSTGKPGAEVSPSEPVQNKSRRNPPAEKAERNPSAPQKTSNRGAGGTKVQAMLNIASKVPYVGAAAKGIQVASIALPMAQQFASKTFGSEGAAKRRTDRNERLREKLSTVGEKEFHAKERLHQKIDDVDVRRAQTPRRSTTLDTLDRKESALQTKLEKKNESGRSAQLRTKLEAGEKASAAHERRVLQHKVNVGEEWAKKRGERTKANIDLRDRLASSTKNEDTPVRGR